ncbi:hypothetical protein F5I97DRAFT_1841123, partial [Phlebopus sp. FC_14]
HTMTQQFTHIHHIAPNIYSFQAITTDGSGINVTLHAEQIHLFIAYDKALHNGAQPPDPPLGYANFTSVFNDEGSVTSCFATATPDGGIHITGPSPTPHDILGEDANHRNVHEREGGRWMSDDRMELVEESLWDSMRRNKIAREKRTRAINERKAKRAAEEAARTVAYPYPTLRPGRKRGASVRVCATPHVDEDDRMEVGITAGGSGNHTEEVRAHGTVEEFERGADDENDLAGGGE